MTTVEKILHLLQNQNLPVGAHLSAQKLADQLQLSRFPITQALAELQKQGFVRQEPNRGYFVAKKLGKQKPKEQMTTPHNRLEHIYLAIAEDRLHGDLPDTVSQALLRERYQMSNAQLQLLLRRMVSEAWMSKKPGYGWTFAPMLTTPDSLYQSYRLRLALEPAALLEPNYHLPSKVIEECRAVEETLLSGAIHRMSAEELHERGVRFHEALVEGSNNPFFIEPLKRVNRVRRLLSYRSTQNRDRYAEHAKQHLHILDLLEKGKNIEASKALHKHLERTLKNLEKITPLFA